MSLPERLRLLPLKSLYFGVVLAMIVVLSVSFVVFQAIAARLQELNIDPILDRADEVQLQDERWALEKFGTEGLKNYTANLNHIFNGQHYLVDAQGIDQVTKQNRAALLPPAGVTMSRRQINGQNIITRRSQDGRYWFVAVGRIGRPHPETFLPYYFLVIGATGALCWLAAVGVLSPVRRIASTIAVFGQGDLAARVQTKRQDEIGQLGRSFNQMAERLERLIVSERRLLSDISHELRSPLARLKFAVKLARTSSDSEAALDRIERDVDRITSLVSDIVEITFVEGDPALQGAERVSMRDIVSDVVRDCALEAQFRGCTIESGGHTEGDVMGSRELLRRAVENVLRNAIRYAPEKTAIKLYVAESERDVVIEVRDFGPGVPEEALTRIFDPFFRVEEARSANGGGSGLGLSIAKRAVQVHHGTIVAENASPGLRVQITIPLVIARA
jgi:signal transduction histidine kinase